MGRLREALTPTEVVAALDRAGIVIPRRSGTMLATQRDLGAPYRADSDG
jgi:hypothetical protein